MILHARPLLAFLIGTAVALLLVGGDSLLLLRDAREERLGQARQALAGQAALLAERLDTGMASWFGLLRVVGGLQPVREGAEDPDALRAALAALVSGSTSLLWLGLLDGEGQPFGGSDNFPALAAPVALARGALASGQPVLDGPRDQPDGPVLDLAIPLDTHVLAAQVALGWAESLRLAEQRRGQSGLALVLLAPDGRAVLPANPAPPAALEARQGIGESGFFVQASIAPSHALASLQPFALRLAAGSVAVSLVVGALLAGLAQLVSRNMAASRHRAEHDPLTGLLNRAGLRAWQTSARMQRVAAVAIDLDGFKPINDLHGHAVGDEVLRGVATAMLARLRPGDAAVRLGGDEFLLLLQPRAEEDGAISAEAVAWRLIRVLAEGVETSAGSLPVGASAGYALVPDHAADLAAALKLADAALYAAKAAGKRTVRCSGA